MEERKKRFQGEKEREQASDREKGKVLVCLFTLREWQTRKTPGLFHFILKYLFIYLQQPKCPPGMPSAQKGPIAVASCRVLWPEQSLSLKTPSLAGRRPATAPQGDRLTLWLPLPHRPLPQRARAISAGLLWE